MRITTVARGGLLFVVAAGVLMLQRRRRARPDVEAPSVHVTRNLAIAGLAAVTVHVLETPVVLPLARTVARRRWGLVHRIPGRRWLRTAIAIVLLDYTLYLWHVLVHRVPGLWRFHLVHHVDLDLDATTGLRFHAGELAVGVPWRAAQVLLIGATPAALVIWQTLTLVSVLFHHSNASLGDRAERLLSWVLTTPRMHEIHHSVDSEQQQTNFSSGLSIWDRLHGTGRFHGRARQVGVERYLDPAAVTLPRILALPFDCQDEAGPEPLPALQG